MYIMYIQLPRSGKTGQGSGRIFGSKCQQQQKINKNKNKKLN